MKQQQVQEHVLQKDRAEKLIANVLNNDNEEGYSMIKQIVKENVKVILSKINK